LCDGHDNDCDGTIDEGEICEQSSIEVTLSSPADNAVLDSSTVDFLCTFTSLQDVVSASLYSDMSGTWDVVETKTLDAQDLSATFTVSDVAEGVYSWNCEITDVLDGKASADNNREFTVMFGDCLAGQTRACDFDYGICRSAVQTCADGEWPGCTASDYESLQGYQADEQSCDGLDNDCDGAVDEDLTECDLPIFIDTGNYDGSTTDFSALPDFELMEDVTLERSLYGKIVFSSPITVARSLFLHDLSDIGFASVHVDSDLLPEFNVPAIITLKGLEFTDPVILGADGLCSDCNVISYASGQIRFTVGGFSNYSIIEECAENWQCTGWSQGTCGVRTCSCDCPYEGCSGDDSEQLTCPEPQISSGGGSPALFKSGSPSLFKGGYIPVRDVCSDNQDNEGSPPTANGCIDRDDFECGAVEQQCWGGVDNDCDGKIDCEDSDCAGNSFCAEKSGVQDNPIYSINDVLNMVFSNEEAGTQEITADELDEVARVEYFFGFLNWLFIGVMILLFIGLIFVQHISMHRIPTKRIGGLEGYVRRKLKQGMTKDMVRKQLQKAGWINEVVDKELDKFPDDPLEGKKAS